jgi:4'-phosphopantetheinyl transferase
MLDPACAPIFVWPVRLNNPALLEPLLDISERRRAHQFRRIEDRDAFVACRGALRLLLARFLAREPAALRFSYGEHEKPSLEDGACAFNVTRTAGLALIAISASGRLGIDLERIREDVDLDALATAFLRPVDGRVLARLPRKRRTRAFFRLWVRHEARVKATGRGLVVPADTSPGTDVAGLWLRDLPVASGYVAALAADGAAARPVVIHRVVKQPLSFNDGHPVRRHRRTCGLMAAFPEVGHQTQLTSDFLAPGHRPGATCK